MAFRIEDQIDENIMKLTERVREAERTMARVDRHIIKSKILDCLYELKEVEGSPEYKKGYYTAIMKAYEVVIKEFKNFEEIVDHKN